ncbi:hypothetical protein [Chitinophaga sp. RAB17]|uniref:hypothetical protein n=1 Tax=Chitinophaga sp. RAB17 TaxID=3233049 RepID=UPI003F9292C0
MNKINDDKLRVFLKENGIAQTTEQFSAELTALLVHKYSTQPISRPLEFNAGKWLGKLIIGILVCFNLTLLGYVGILYLPPVLFMCLIAAILGVWGMIGIMKKEMPDRSPAV